MGLKRTIGGEGSNRRRVMGSMEFLKGGATVRAKSLQHCLVSLGVKSGEKAMTCDGHVVQRLEGPQWRVVACPDEQGRYKAGDYVKSRTLFWRMNGLVSKLA